MVLDLFGEAIREPREPAHGHSHRQILTFDIAGADELFFGVADHRLLFAADALCWAVPLLTFGIIAVDLNQHGVVNLVLERIDNRIDINLHSIRGELHPVGETAREILNELRGALSIALAEKPARNQLGLGIDCNPGPHVASDALFRNLG
jgi:hypothetical protein